MNTKALNYNKIINVLRSKICEWQREHKSEYSLFMKEIENADNGDFAFYFKIFESIAELIPQPVMWELEAFLSNNGNDDDFDEMTQLKRKEVNKACSEMAAWSGYCRIDLDPDNDDAISFVSKKDANDISHYYLQIKAAEELWNDIPLSIRMCLQMFTGQSGKELGACFKRIIAALVLSSEGFCEQFERYINDNTISTSFGCILYYISVDGGLVRSANHLSKLLHTTEDASDLMIFIPTIIGKMAEASVKHGHDKKSSWKELKTSDNADICKEVSHSLADTTALRGRRIIETETFHLDNMLKGDKTKIKEQIKKFRKTYSYTTHLAFLLMILVKSGCVDKLLPYPHFHHAMEEFEGKKYDMDRVSRMYTYMFYNEEDFEQSKLPKWCNGRMIIRNWLKTFSRLSNISENTVKNK